MAGGLNFGKKKIAALQLSHLRLKEQGMSTWLMVLDPVGGRSRKKKTCLTELPV